jgi:hypothetical protein
MASIPMTNKPFPYVDPDNGAKYFLRPPCGDTETALMELSETLPQEKKAREAYFKKMDRNAMGFINSSIDIILCGWESGKKKLPAFPDDGKPSQSMRADLKLAIMAFYNEQRDFTGEEIRK